MQAAGELAFYVDSIGGDSANYILGLLKRFVLRRVHADVFIALGIDNLLFTYHQTILRIPVLLFAILF